VTVQAAIDEWLDTLRLERGLSPLTVRNYGWKVNTVLASVDELTPLEVKRAINKVAEERGWCAGSIYQAVASVRSLLHLCRKREY